MLLCLTKRIKFDITKRKNQFQLDLCLILGGGNTLGTMKIPIKPSI